MVRHRGAGGTQEAEAQRLAQATDSGGTAPGGADHEAAHGACAEHGRGPQKDDAALGHRRAGVRPDQEGNGVPGVLHAGDREGSGRVEARVYGPQSAEVVPQRSEHGAAALRGTTPQRRSRLKVPSRQLGYAVVGRQSLRHLRLRQLAASTHLASIRYPDGLLASC